LQILLQLARNVVIVGLGYVKPFIFTDSIA